VDPTTGLFRLAYPVPQSVGLPVADSVATAAAYFLGGPDPFNTQKLPPEHERGAPIDFGQLGVCARPVDVSSAFQTFPAVVPTVIRRAVVAQWAVSLCGPSGDAQVSIGIKDLPHGAPPDSGSIVDPGTVAGGYVYGPTGVPPQFATGLPLTPEGAVAAVYSLTGQRVVATPVAFDQWDDRGSSQLPLCASWRIVTEAPVIVRSAATGAVISASEFYVHNVPSCFSAGIALYVASRDQPTTWPLVFPRDSADVGGALDTVDVPLSGPMLFGQVTVVH
jgi:hypothetical protein